MAPLAVLNPVESDIEWLSGDSCAAYCERRRDALRKDQEALEQARDDLLRTQSETVVLGLCKLNKNVKNMSVGDFNAAYDCDVVDLIRKLMAAGDVRSGAKRVRAAQPGATGGAGLSLKTPAPHRMGKPPMTTRTARKGETVKSYSVNGSPVDPYDPGEVVVTAKKPRGAKDDGEGAASTRNAFPVTIGIGAGNGATIDLADPDQRRNLDTPQKAQAKQQLMAIQEQMNKLMADF